MMKPQECILFSGGAPGAEADFGSAAERFGVEEFGGIGESVLQGHLDARHRGMNLMLRAGNSPYAYRLVRDQATLDD